ncbi:MAG: hypothetical protein ACXWCP_23920 [Burkholderiales bacterium]
MPNKCFVSVCRTLKPTARIKLGFGLPTCQPAIDLLSRQANKVLPALLILVEGPMATGFFTRSAASGVVTGDFDRDECAGALLESNIASARGLAVRL